VSRLNDISLATQVAVFGNKRAFDQLVRQYQGSVRRFLLSQTMGNEALSDDLAQDTFLKAYTHMAQYRGTSSLLTWLIRIAYNVWYDYCRSTKVSEKSRVKSEELAAAMPTAGDSSVFTLHSSLHFDLPRALAVLRPEERSCITLQMVDGYAIDEIAAITGIPANTVKSHLRRGKERLANYLRNNGYDR